MGFSEALVDDVCWRFVQLDENGEHHGKQEIVLFTFRRVIGYHRAQDGSKEVLHETLFDSETFLDEQFKRSHEDLGLFGHHAL